MTTPTPHPLRHDEEWWRRVEGDFMQYLNSAGAVPKFEDYVDPFLPRAEVERMRYTWAGAARKYGAGPVTDGCPELWRIAPNRIFASWANGTWITSQSSDFQRTFDELVERLGPPDVLEFRRRDEGVTVESFSQTPPPSTQL